MVVCVMILAVEVEKLVVLTNIMEVELIGFGVRRNILRIGKELFTGTFLEDKVWKKDDGFSVHK